MASGVAVLFWMVGLVTAVCCVVLALRLFWSQGGKRWGLLAFDLLAPGGAGVDGHIVLAEPSFSDEGHARSASRRLAKDKK